MNQKLNEYLLYPKKKKKITINMQNLSLNINIKKMVNRFTVSNTT